MRDPAVRIACLGNGCCACSRGGDARRATSTCARRKRVIDAGAFRTARGSASGGIGRSTRLLAVRSLRLAACTERERHCTERGGHWALPSRAECRTLSATGSCPYRRYRETFSEIGRHAETRSTRSAPGRKNGGFGESSAREWRWYTWSSSRSRCLSLLPCHSRACRPQHATVARAPHLDLFPPKLFSSSGTRIFFAGVRKCQYPPVGHAGNVPVTADSNLKFKLPRSCAFRRRRSAANCTEGPKSTIQRFKLLAPASSSRTVLTVT